MEQAEEHRSQAGDQITCQGCANLNNLFYSFINFERNF